MAGPHDTDKEDLVGRRDALVRALNRVKVLRTDPNITAAQDASLKSQIWAWEAELKQLRPLIYLASCKAQGSIPVAFTEVARRVLSRFEFERIMADARVIAERRDEEYRQRRLKYEESVKSSLPEGVAIPP